MIGFIGGSGIYEALPLNDVREEDVTTPYGDPSAPVTVGEFGDTGTEVAFLPRHGPDHQRSPTNLPYKANIYALKQLGVERILASNAVGSLKEELPPQTLVVPDQIFDRTKHRDSTFFGDGIVVHQPFADPYCPHMVEHLHESAEEATDAETQEGGTYVCIEGPQYSTRAESEFYKAQGWDLVGMTAIPEAKLAREAEMCYATVAGVTDYDVWKADSEVTLEEVLENAAANEEAIKRTVEHAIETLPEERDCDCGHALDGTVNTPTEAIPEETRERVDALVGDYL
ncbi:MULTISPECIES: S-methyl-5'-thioadenosine phosphorylase [unclassified Halobacterium]|jgi:5'-methylthioadenosine phosphorylase|uniref:S-methyl-5'-thioadenosine phosphorylase n=1 Tax=unclassified Halobacterium TaxID=2668073 RepID=UPI001E455B88|nr:MULTISPECIES: S-methyl-5'-thioadenosine phosphorylase [unclassified Halobacterium]MCD2198490.1 S-methyl-5'-thioadenosine phosphorylase [Halobacterium sp. KA-4]MCD2202033.1 S-methyl-5'-thioadenosine phosphorylase [Halobacterium sp. KA-6]